jgi:hypothetical protein
MHPKQKFLYYFLIILTIILIGRNRTNGLKKGFWKQVRWIWLKGG